MRKKRVVTAVLCVFAAGMSLLFIYPFVYAADLNAGVVLSDDQGTVLYEQNREKGFVPASILKILTSLSAIQLLGDGYRFPTAYSFDAGSKNLYVKGFGDPLFTSEVIEQLCHEILLKIKTKHIHHIVLDNTFYSEQIQIPGTGDTLNPYDAPVGALCANFNTITFQWDRQKNRFISGEPQTPLLPFFLEDIKKTHLKKGRIILPQQQSVLYPGLLIKYFLEKQNLNITGSVLTGEFKTSGKQPFIFQSPYEIRAVVQQLLKYSNNFIANQLFLSMGAKTYGAPATLEKSVRAVKRFSKEQIRLNPLILSEGSGISRLNVISPDQMMKILIEFLPYYSLLNHQGEDFFKTGTLTGVRTRAGYITGKANRLYPYVIMVNQENKGVESILRHLINRVKQLN